MALYYYYYYHLFMFLTDPGIIELYQQSVKASDTATVQANNVLRDNSNLQPLLESTKSTVTVLQETVTNATTLQDQIQNRCKMNRFHLDSLS